MPAKAGMTGGWVQGDAEAAMQQFHGSFRFEMPHFRKFRFWIKIIPRRQGEQTGGVLLVHRGFVMPQATKVVLNPESELSEEAGIV